MKPLNNETVYELIHSQQMVQFMMGNGAVSLSESMKDSVISGVRAEFERREAEIRQSYELELTALRNEISSLKNKNNQKQQEYNHTYSYFFVYYEISHLSLSLN